MTHSSAQGSATSAWSFIQSAPRPNLRAVSAMQVRSRCSASGKTESFVLGDEGAVDVVDVLGALAVGERGVEDHDGAAVHDEADLAAEGAV